MATSLVVIALIVTGTMVGVELCVAALVNPMFDRLPGGDGLLGRADAARVLGRLMPWWYAASIALTVLVAMLVRDDPARVWVTAAGAGLLVVSILMSVFLLVPINNRAKTWTPGHAPPDWRDQLRRWDRLHYLRVAVIAGGLACLALGAVGPTAA